jgi:hypothetical protein
MDINGRNESTFRALIDGSRSIHLETADHLRMIAQISKDHLTSI